MIGSDWYRLDNSAIVYQMIITRETQSLFRLGAQLKTAVDHEALRQSVEDALVRYPFFKSELRHGFFRPYLGKNTLPPLVFEDDGIVLKILSFRKNNKYLFRTSYFKNTIYMDFFHGLCDGSGAMEFLKTVLYYYHQRTEKFISPSLIRLAGDAENPEETEDAFCKYYKKFDLFDGIKKMAGGNGYRLKGKQFAFPGFGLIQITVPTDKLLAAARSFGCSITALLTSINLLAIHNVYGDKPQKEPYVAFIPVNLRKRYPSDTLGNFTVFAKCVIPKNTEMNLESLTKTTSKLIAEQLEEKELDIKLSFASLMATLPLLKFMPLFIKSFISKLGRSFGNKTKQTFILSNLGKVNLSESEELDSLCFCLNCSKKTPDNMGVVSYENKTVISFTRKLISTDTEREFAKILASLIDGDVEVCSNYRESCDVL